MKYGGHRHAWTKKAWMETCSHSQFPEGKKVKVIATQLCPTLCDPVDHSPPSSSVLGILQARILEWVATSYSRGSSQLRDHTRISCIGSWILHHWTTREAHCWYINSKYPKPSCLSYPVHFLPQTPICLHSSLSHFFKKCWHPPSIQNTPHSCTSKSCLCDWLVIYVRCTCIHG